MPRAAPRPPGTYSIRPSPIPPCTRRDDRLKSDSLIYMISGVQRDTHTISTPTGSSSTWYDEGDMMIEPGQPDDRTPRAAPRPPGTYPRAIAHTEQLECSYDPKTDEYHARILDSTEPVVTRWDNSPRRPDGAPGRYLRCDAD